ncbi:hypothetical protein PInf_005104 [Phytophthora infestans]|nr:hypothetical protein PInf_005104 [Phytophthora infestans]
MPSFTIATENPISQIWKELTKKGWKYVPPGGSLSGTEGVDYFLGSDSLMRYCRKKGGFAFKIEPPAASEAPRPTPAASEATSPTPAAPEVTPPAAVVPETTSSTPIKSVESSPTRVALAAAAKPTPRKPRRAAKATSQADDQVQQAAVPPTRAEAKRKASGPNTKPKRRRSKAARDLELPVTEAPIGAVNAGRRGVTLDDFDGDGFLAALRRDRLFEVGGEDDFNVGDGDWLLSIDSDAEGDEESILQDENDAVDDNDFGSADDAESGDDAGVESEEVPVEFDLTAEDLDRLQEDEWDVYMEAESGRLWRKIAAETNNYRRESIDAVAQHIHTRARHRQQSVPSTPVLTLDEYRRKLARKSTIQPTRSFASSGCWLQGRWDISEKVLAVIGLQELKVHSLVEL